MNSSNPNKWKGEVVEIESTTTSSGKPNLQEKFNKFRDQRMKKHAMQQNLTTINDNINRSDPERMQKLREKFVDQCKK